MERLSGAIVEGEKKQRLPELGSWPEKNWGGT